MISFEGGGWCGSASGLNPSLDNCLARSKNDLGSSNAYPATLTQSYGILSDNINNEYRDWTIFHLKYCDGTGHQGYRKSPILYKNTNLYFRGHNVTIAQLNSIDKASGLFSTATDVIITGQSAGGLATFLWTNYIVDRLPKTTKVWSLPDSGIFLDSMNFATKQNSYKLLFQNFMKLSNEEIDPPTKECVAAYPQEQYKCLFAQYIHPFIKVPLFAIESAYDSWSVANILGLRCDVNASFASCNQTEMSFIEEYHTNTTAVLKEIAAKKENGYWSPSCSDHVYSTSTRLFDPAFRIPAHSENSLIACISHWISGKAGSN